MIEQPIVDEIDLNGWDLRKALRLLARKQSASEVDDGPPLFARVRASLSRDCERTWM